MKVKLIYRQRAGGTPAYAQRNHGQDPADSSRREVLLVPAACQNQAETGDIEQHQGDNRSGNALKSRQSRIDQSNLAATAANTAAMTVDNSCPAWTTVEYRPSAQTATDSPGLLAHSYGLEGLRP